MVGSVDVEAAKDGAEGLNSHPGPRTTGYAVETSGKLWSVYLAESERHDKALAESWKADMDGLLIFAGLFSAVVTAFLVGSLQQMTQSNQTQGTTPTSTSTSANSSSLLRANALWCSSLLSSLLSALCATLVQQWARQYTQALGRRTAAHQRARVRAFLLQGIERSGVKAVVEGAPALLHLAMFLFIAGLVDITAPASRMLSLLSLSVLVAIAAFYLALSWFPLHDLQSPYHTPLSSALWYIKQAVRPLNFTNVEGWTVVVDSGSLSRGREEYATATIHGTQERDLASLSWTLSSLIDRGDCEPFIEGIAGFMRSDKIVGAPVIMHELVKRKDLARHILELLISCIEPAAHDSIDVRRRQSISGLGALRALTANWFSDDAAMTLQDGDPHGVWKWCYSFPERMIDVTMSLRSVNDSVISMHARCTAAVAVWRLLVDYGELGAYTKQKLVTVERLLAYLESTRERGRRRGGRRARARDTIKEKINHDLLAVWAQSTQMHIEALRMNSPQQDSKRAQFQNWDAEKADLKMMRYLWEQNMCPPEAWLYDDDVELQHNETDNGESSMLDTVLAYLSSHAKLLYRTLKPLESTQLPLNAFVDEATECLDQWSSTTMKELMPKIIASGHVANVIQLIKHATMGPRRTDADQLMILETLETITFPIRASQGKLNERGQRSLLGLLKFLKEEHLSVMFRDIDNLSGSMYQFIVKIGEKIIPLAVQGLGTPNLWQSAQSILFEYEDTCPDLANTFSDAQTLIRGKLLHYQFSTPHPPRKPLLLPAPAPSESHSSPASVTTHSRLPPSTGKTAAPISPDSEKSSKLKTLEVEIYRLVPTDSRRNAHKIMRPLYLPNGHPQETYIDVPVEQEYGEFIDTTQHPRGPTRSHDVAPTAQAPSPSSSRKHGRVGSPSAQKPHDSASMSPARPPSQTSSNRRSREGWWTARGSHDEAPTPHSRPLSSSSSPNRRGQVGSWATWQVAPASPTRSLSPPSASRPGSAGSWTRWRLHEGAATPPVQPPSPSSSAASSNINAEHGFVLAPRLEPFAPPMQASASLLTAITAETEPDQDGGSLPVVVVQKRSASASGSYLPSSRAPSPKSLVPAVPPAPRESLFGPRSPRSPPSTTPPPAPRGSLFGPRSSRSPPPATPPPPERSQSSPPSRSQTLIVARHGLGLYIPQQSHSGPLSLSAPGTRFHTPVDEPVESDSLDPALPTPAALGSDLTSASAVASSSRLTSMSSQSRSPGDQERLRVGQIVPLAASPLLRASESGDDEVVGNGDVGGGGGAEDEHKPASKSEDELVQQDSGQRDDVQIDESPSPPHEYQNPDTNIVTHPSTLNQQQSLLVIQKVDADASASAHTQTRKRETDIDAPVSSPTTAALNPSL